MACNRRGDLVGSVSGGCVEADLLERLRRAPPGPPQVIGYGVTTGEAARVGLPCGGQLELVVEALVPSEPWEALLGATDRRGRIMRTLDLPTGAVSHEAGDGSELRFDGRRLSRLFGPSWRLVIIGAGQLGALVAQMALTLEFEVILCDPRPEYAAGARLPGTVHSSLMPDDAVLAFAMDARSAVVALAHDPRIDDLGLMEALRGEAFFVGALGSIRTQAARKSRLLSLGLPADAVERLRGPVGLPIGSRTPAEIAVAILAELVAARRRTPLPS